MHRLSAWSFAKIVYSSRGGGRGKKRPQKCNVFNKDCVWLGIYYLIFLERVCFICQLAQERSLRTTALCKLKTTNCESVLGGYWSPQTSNRRFRDKWKTFADNFLSYCDWHNEMDNSHQECYFYYIFFALLVFSCPVHNSRSAFIEALHQQQTSESIGPFKVQNTFWDF